MGDRVLWSFRHDLPGETDEQLTDRARTGDKSAFGELYRRHRKAAESTAWCLLRSKSDADDVVSDAFTGVLSALRNGRGPRDNFRGYLLACVRNGCRSRRTPAVLVDQNQLDRWNPALEDPEKYVEADTVARAFSSLAPRWQQALWMTEVEQLPATEVSERLELSPNATAALTHRARQAFAEAYLAEHIGATTAKDCLRIAPHLPGYVRNQLREQQLAAVERHLVNCQRCAAAVADLRDVNASLRSLLPVAPQTLGAAAVATEATMTATTMGGGLTLGLPSTGLLVKGLVAVLLVAPVLSTDSPSSAGRETRVESAAEAVATSPIAEIDAAAPVTEPTASSDRVEPIPTTTIEATTPAAPEPALVSPESVSEEQPAAMLPVVPVTQLAVPSVPALPVPSLLQAVPPLPDVLDGVVNDAVLPLVGGATEPVVETLDEALAMMGFGTSGATVVMLRSLVPILDGPLLGPVVDELLDLTSIGDGSIQAAATAGEPAASGDLDDPSNEAGAPVLSPGGSPTVDVSGAPPGGSAPVSTPGAAVSIPAVTTPAVTTPAMTTPAVTTPAISVPSISVPLPNLPVTTLAAITLPTVTLPDLLG